MANTPRRLRLIEIATERRGRILIHEMELL